MLTARLFRHRLAALLAMVAVSAGAHAAAAATTALPPGTVFNDTLADGTPAPAMVVVPPGRFVMGSPDMEPGRNDNEGPRHQVTIAHPFALGQTEVTVAQFRKFVQATGYRTDSERNAGDQPGCFSEQFHGSGGWYWMPGRSWKNPGFTQGSQHPVVCVSWNDAQRYIAWLSAQTHRKYRLPSESEWEYAARAGSQDIRFWGDDPDHACRYANVADLTSAKRYPQWPRHECTDGYVFTAPVASFKPNPFGLYDMLGNVWEWVDDCYHSRYFNPPSDGSPWLSGPCRMRVQRGGSAADGPSWVRSAVREGISPANGFALRGFRVATDVADTSARFSRRSAGVAQVMLVYGAVSASPPGR